MVLWMMRQIPSIISCCYSLSEVVFIYTALTTVQNISCEVVDDNALSVMLAVLE